MGVVRFETREAAARNSLRPEQGEWWAAASRCFEGEVMFHDCDDAIMMLDGGSDEAGFVQVIQGRLDDPRRFREFMSQPMDMLHEARPEIIGGTIAIDADGWFTEDDGLPQRGRGPRGRAARRCRTRWPSSSTARWTGARHALPRPAPPLVRQLRLGRGVTALPHDEGPPRVWWAFVGTGGRERTRTSDPHRVKVVR